MHVAIRLIVGAVLFAVGLLLSSWLLKGQPAGDWVDAALYIGLAGFLLSQTYFAVPESQKNQTESMNRPARCEYPDLSTSG